MALQLHWSRTTIDLIIDLIIVHVNAGELNASKHLVGQLVADT